MTQAVFFIALLVSGEAGETITAFKQEAAQQFGASRALNSPPHLTLIPPFTWPEVELDVLAACLQDFAAQHPPPPVRLLNFSSFPPRVIFVNVEPNPELQQFQQALETHLEVALQVRTDRQYGFHPHVTVAFKDLRESVFPEAWAYFSAQTFAHTFQPPGIALLRHNGQFWEVNGEFGA